MRFRTVGLVVPLTFALLTVPVAAEAQKENASDGS